MSTAVARKAPSVAGVAVIAADTGRMLMLQRGLDDDSDPAAGTWEWPGGHLEASDDSSLHGGMREWAEEVGRRFPRGGTVEHTWTSGNGIYQGHVVVIDREDQVNLAGRRTVSNADDDYSEQAAWWRIEDARKNPALRRECRAAPWDELAKISRRVTKSGDLSRAGKSLNEASLKDMYASMAPMTYVRGLGASPSRPRQSPPPAIVERRYGPSLRGQVRRLKRRSRKGGVKGLADARVRLETKSALDPETLAIWRVASGWDERQDGLKAAIDRLELKAPQPASGDEVCMSCGRDVGEQYETVDGAKHGFPGADAVVCLDCADPEVKKGDHHSSTHPDIPNGPGRNWVEDRGGLPSYVHRVARHIAADSGYSWSHAIAAAINVMKRRAAKGNAAAAASLSRWEAMKASKSIPGLVEAKARL